MADIVNPSLLRDADSYLTAGSLAYGGAGDGFVFDGSSATRIAQHSTLNEGSFDSFSQSSSGSSLDVTIEPGEAFVMGSWTARDAQTTVTLAASTNNQTVYLGWDQGSGDTVIIGLGGDFSSGDPRFPIWTFDTDGSGVTSSTDERRIGYSQDVTGAEYYGDEDFSISYDSSNDAWLVRDEVNDIGALSVSKNGDVAVPEGDLTDGTNTIYDSTNDHVPQARLENDSISAGAGNGLSGGGSTALGGSFTFDINVSDFAGAHLSDDGSGNLSVDDDFVLNSGDDVDGELRMNDTFDANNDASSRVVLPVGADKYAT